MIFHTISMLDLYLINQLHDYMLDSVLYSCMMYLCPWENIWVSLNSSNNLTKDYSIWKDICLWYEHDINKITQAHEQSCTLIFLVFKDRIPSHCTALLLTFLEPSSRGSPQLLKAAFQHHHCRRAKQTVHACLQSVFELCFE